MSTIPERLEKLRAKMQEKGIDIYIIPTADFHQSEYVGEHFKAREYITGFTGSAGTAVVSKTEARLKPVRMCTVQITVLVRHFRFNPEPEF